MHLAYQSLICFDERSIFYVFRCSVGVGRPQNVLAASHMVIDTASCENIRPRLPTSALSRVFLSDDIYLGEFSKDENLLSKYSGPLSRSVASPTVKTVPTHLAERRMFVRECGMSEYRDDAGRCAVRLLGPFAATPDRAANRPRILPRSPTDCHGGEVRPSAEVLLGSPSITKLHVEQNSEN